jgi:hypothetical protein
LRELEPLAVHHVGGVHDHERTSEELGGGGEGLVPEQMFVVILHGQIDAIGIGRCQPHPVERVEQQPEERALDVDVEKLGAELLKNPVAEQAVVHRGERPAGNRRETIHFVPKAFLDSLPRDTRPSEFVQPSVGERAALVPPRRRSDSFSLSSNVISHGSRADVFLRMTVYSSGS